VILIEDIDIVLKRRMMVFTELYDLCLYRTVRRLYDTANFVLIYFTVSKV